MSGSLIIREARGADIDALVALLGAFFDEDAAALPSVFARADKAELRDYWAELLGSGAQRVFVAELGGEVAGVLTLEEVSRAAGLGRRADTHAFVHFLAVAPAHRRKGVATRLLRRAHRWSSGHGLHTVRLHVWEHNEAARRLYERLGYATLSRTMAIGV